MYNEQQKNRYLKQSDMTEDSKNLFIRISSTAAKVEALKDLDLSNFNRSEVIDLLKAYNSRSREYLSLICNHYAKYYSWCSAEGLVDSSNFTNWYDVKLSQPIIKEVVPSELLDAKYFDDEKMYEYVEMVKDHQNKLLLYAPYIGIDGVDHVDLINLRIEDLHESRKAITLYSGRVAYVDDLFIELIKNADNSVRYDRNGDGQLTRKPTTYGESQYVLKVCGDKNKDTLITGNNIRQRYLTIKEQTNNRYLNIQTVGKNGLINYIKRYFDEKGVSLYDALYKKKDEKVVKRNNEILYVYEEELQTLITNYGSNILPKMLRYQMADIIKYWKENEQL